MVTSLPLPPAVRLVGLFEIQARQEQKGCLLDKTKPMEHLLLWLRSLPLRGPWRRSHGRAASVLEELLDDRGVGQRGDVAQVSLVAGDFAEHTSHDFTCRAEDAGDVWGNN